MQSSPVATTAVELIDQRIQALEHPQAGTLKLTMFSYPSEAVRKTRHQIAEALVLLLESNGYRICNGPTEAQSYLEELGYTVTYIEDPAQDPLEDPHSINIDLESLV